MWISRYVLAFDRHWDARTGVFLGEKAIGEEPSLYDPVASQLTCRTSKNNPETTIVSIRGESVGWFPAKVFPWGLHPDRRAWAGATGNDLYLIRLEGNREE